MILQKQLVKFQLMMRLQILFDHKYYIQMNKKIEIWSTTFVFYIRAKKNKKKEILPEAEYKVEGVICKRIPVQFLLNEGLVYKRAIKNLLKDSDSTVGLMNTLVDDKETGLKKFKIIYDKKMGEVN